MIDPIGSFLRIREFYLTYLETAFRIADPGITLERRALLETPGNLCANPLLEPIPRYRTVDWELRELADVAAGPLAHFETASRKAFARLAQCGLFDSPNAKLYLHQATMLSRGSQQGTPGIVTSGTGSGKTESFLLPVLATIVDEARRWRAPEKSYLKTPWWHRPNGERYEKFTEIPQSARPLKKNPTADPFQPHRAGENRPAAVRCLILYPMNALVEDQLPRLRKALDSEPAKLVIDEECGHNRIFFGRYTGKTPVTGFNKHPRVAPSDDSERRGRQLKELFDHMVSIEETQNEVDKLLAEGKVLAKDDRYLFPRIGGGELLSRWDMQLTPPDILITNVSMLGAILNREVDSGIFESTKKWLSGDDASYFFLVTDELHLQRGSAGTEVAYLLRLLFEKLGLDRVENRHKLRILSSSASLPTDGVLGDRSARYLWDMFGTHGTRKKGEDGKKDLTLWKEAIVTGQSESDQPRSTATLRPEPYITFARKHGATGKSVGQSVSPGDLLEEWSSVGEDLGIRSTGQVHDDVRLTSAEAGFRLSRACWSELDGRVRATSVDVIAERLFGLSGERGVEAVRGLLIVRGVGDDYRTHFPDRPKDEFVRAPTFRMHTFFRSVEGLYAPASGVEGIASSYRSPERRIGALSIERTAIAGASQAEAVPPKLLELLYCECCGTTFLGGMRRRRDKSSDTELLPYDPDLDGLPDSSAGRLFERLNYDQYALFWPSAQSVVPSVPTGAPESWAQAHLDPATAVITVQKLLLKKTITEDSLKGWLFWRQGNPKDAHGRSNTDEGSHVPYQCPSCQTDYSPRPKSARELRLSPIRHFRTGFAKTTQLLASELFGVLRLNGDEKTSKLVSFSDSRQDAANAALDIETRHHEDVRRETLVQALRAISAQRSSKEDLERKLKEAQQRRRAAEDVNDEATEREETAQIGLLRGQLRDADDFSVSLSRVLEDPDGATYKGSRESGRDKPKELLRTFARLGIHPTDPAGIRRIPVDLGGEKKHYDWTDLIGLHDGEYDWLDVADGQQYVDAARSVIVQELQAPVNEILFSRTYFSLEESGLGYLCLPQGANIDDGAWRRQASWVRVFGDAYRLKDTRFEESAKPWADENVPLASNRVMKWATAVATSSGARRELGVILGALLNAGHPQGLLRTIALRIRLADPEDAYWRCSNCARVHLHRGADVCTRCFLPLPDSPTGTAGQLQENNFLGLRIRRRGGGAFRLHCEELTGQTDDPAARQRKFRGVIMPDFADGTRKVVPERDAIDLLAVTTTMEVGVDIGPLQAVFQANMPPQRFNYQQRVGRAGRRGQAFSMAVTVCRTRSHDLYYFREPSKITGDAPPPPFLTKGMPDIATRFLRKWWLNAAFTRLRATELGPWPADSMRPPDIHGEFLPTSDYDDTWKARLAESLQATEAEARRVAEMLCENAEVRFDEIWREPATMIEEIEELRKRPDSIQAGLAHSLAELGKLPMYGMPTRTRDLYIGSKRAAIGSEEEWIRIDRELDLAVFEFAPGALIRKDKSSYRSIGFTGAMRGFSYRKKGHTVEPLGKAFADPFWLVWCPSCNSWYRFEAAPGESLPKCAACDEQLYKEYSAECREPLGFRTNLRQGIAVDREAPLNRHRSMVAEAGLPETKIVTLINASASVNSGRIYKLNRGDLDADSPGVLKGFNAVSGEDLHRRRDSQVTFSNQWLDPNWLGDRIFGVHDFTPDGGAESKIERAWLAAPKTTDLLSISPTQMHPGLALDNLVGRRSLDGLSPDEQLRALAATAARASALSATFILANRAALELDIDPEEFDVLDPRVSRLKGGKLVPILQIADHLVNGAGFVRALVDNDHELLRMIIDSAVSNTRQYPLEKALEEDHEQTCEQACYRCLLRFRNQPYHGLLDWRLGLAYLASLRSVAFSCGLDTDFADQPFLASWRKIVDRDIGRVRREFPLVEDRTAGELRALRFDKKSSWVIVAHPLWNIDAPLGKLAQAIEAMSTEPFRVVDSFNLARRPVTIRSVMLNL